MGEQPGRPGADAAAADSRHLCRACRSAATARLGAAVRHRRCPLKGLRRRADLVFGPAKVAVFIDGCFWHGCPDHGCPDPPPPTAG
ncbi:hypothetical protein [uncultured Friedmanniella sp.]|uniref:hypothetical protein n=1 Tax=uncultured Friedmanniella sp. TaxID=335381 RepID=UPI0035C966A8